jgi:hypothetical protein
MTFIKSEMITKQTMTIKDSSVGVLSKKEERSLKSIKPHNNTVNIISIKP